MSVSITITGNKKYCDKNGLFREVSDDYGTFREYPFDMNLANGNFASFFGAMGMVEAFGEIYPQKLSAKLSALQANDAEREYSEFDTESACHIIDCGLTKVQISRYTELLKVMCDEAERREEKIVWG